MLKSLVGKELRELLPAIFAAIAAQVFLIGGLYHSWKNNFNDAEAIWPLLYLTALVFAIVSGSAQIWRETSGGNFQFLLHRPVSRESILGIKLVVGAGTTLLVVAAPLLMFSLYVDSSYRWQDISRKVSPMAWQLCAGILLLYLGAFLSSLRPADGMQANSFRCAARFYCSSFCK